MKPDMNVHYAKRPYQRPVVAHVIIDPVKEMLTDCTQSPNKTSPSYGPDGQTCVDCCNVSS